MTPDRARGGRPVALAALGGFALGAATVLLVVWFYGAGQREDGTPRPAPPRAAPGPSLPPSRGAAPPPANPSLPPPAAPPSSAEVDDLSRRQLLVPVQGVRREALVDSFTDDRSGGRQHHAIDILAPRNTPILAVEDGTIAKLFTSVRGGLTVYQLDPSTAYIYYYAHLERYADGLKQGDAVRRGQVLGYVGTSGDAPPESPHLHFEITRLTPEKHWWEGTPIDPFPILHGSAERQAPRRPIDRGGRGA